MDSTHPTAGWEKVGDRFYRKTQLYTAVFDLDFDLDNYFVAGAPYGGAVGVSILVLILTLMLILTLTLVLVLVIIPLISRSEDSKRTRQQCLPDEIQEADVMSCSSLP